MGIIEIIEKVMETQGVSAPALERRLGLTRNTVFNRLYGVKNKGLKVAKAYEMLRAMDYKIVVMPADGKVPSGAYVVEESGEE